MLRVCQSDIETTNAEGDKTKGNNDIYIESEGQGEALTHEVRLQRVEDGMKRLEEGLHRLEGNLQLITSLLTREQSLSLPSSEGNDT